MNTMPNKRMIDLLLEHPAPDPVYPEFPFVEAERSNSDW